MDVTITDNLTNTSVTVDPFDIAESLEPWFPEAPHEVAEAISALEEAARRGEPTDELAQYLAVSLHWNA